MHFCRLTLRQNDTDIHEALRLNGKSSPLNLHFEKITLPKLESVKYHLRDYYLAPLANPAHRSRLF